MDAERTPSGQRDMGDDSYGDSIVEAARHVLETCVRQTNRGGWVKRFTPSPPLDQAFKDKVTRALYALPTNEKVSTTFNHTRAPGPAGSSAVTYLLPRREPVGEWSKSTDASDAVVEPVWESVVVVDVHQSSISTAFPVLDQFANPRFVAEPPPVLRIDMLGNQVTAASMWEVWTAGIAVNTLCVLNGRQGLALAIGE
ncbi:MAG: hypothetical protein Q9199_005344 [Rusavskia elegans]